MPAMLTGRYPEKVKAPSYTEYPDNLLTLFGKYYDLNAYETISQLCPPSQLPLDRRQPGPGRAAGRARRLGPGLQGDRLALRHRRRPGHRSSTRRPPRSPRSKDGKPLDPQFRFNQLRLNQPSRFNDFLAGLKPQPTGRP